MVDATVNVRIRKRLSGMIGSGTLVSTQQNAASSSTERTPVHRITGEPHAYSVPPHVVSRMIAVTPAESSVRPRTSILCGTRTTGTCSTVAIAKSATIPIGMLM